MIHIPRARSLAAALLLASALAGPAGAHDGHATPPWQEATAWPDRIVLTLEGDPSTSLAVSWRTASDVKAPAAEIAPATPDARFDLAARQAKATTETLDLQAVELKGVKLPMPANKGLPTANYHSVRFDGLQPDTLYAYRVQGGDGVWSEWFQARTAPSSGPVRFIYLGDAQNGILSHWSRTVRAAFQAAPDARFIIHAGDLVNHGSRDFEWAEWFKASGFIHGMVAAVPVAGNHEYEALGLSEADKQRVLSALWRPQFRLPVDPALPADLRETVYEVRYSPDLHVFVLNSNARDMAEQARWLDAKLSASDARWRVVTMHHPIYSSAKERDNAALREALLPILTRHKVDMVLQGHDHTYARGMLPPGAQTPERQAVGQGGGLSVMFVNSVSGPKQYEFKKSRWDEYRSTDVGLQRFAENTQFFQVIEVDEGALSYRAYTADGQLYDSVQIAKDEAGRKRVTAGPASTMATRLFENSAAYPEESPP